MIHPAIVAQAPAPPAAAQAPIDIHACGMARPMFWIDWREMPVRIVFVNRASTPATDVTFHVRWYYEVRTVTLHGLFSPGVSISHTFNNVITNTLYAPPAFACNVVSLTLQNGTAQTYQQPEPYPVEEGFPTVAGY